MEQSILINFLKSFFKLFKAEIENYKVINKKIFGTIGWSNEIDKQDFVFTYDFGNSSLSKLKLLCDYLNTNNLIEGDKIILTETDLIFTLIKAGWNENNAKDAINLLCSFDVKMLDDGEETDSFFIHF